MVNKDMDTLLQHPSVLHHKGGKYLETTTEIINKMYYTNAKLLTLTILFSYFEATDAPHTVPSKQIIYTLLTQYAYFSSLQTCYQSVILNHIGIFVSLKKSSSLHTKYQSIIYSVQPSMQVNCLELQSKSSVQQDGREDFLQSPLSALFALSTTPA